MKNKKHTKWIAHLPCIVCGRWPPNVPHHLLKGVTRGMGLKADDSHTVPLCHWCHQDLHLNGDETDYFAVNEIEPLEVAAHLYELSGKESALDWIIDKYRDRWERRAYDKTRAKLGIASHNNNL